MASINNLNYIENMNIQNPNLILGKGLNMPFNASNSGGRKIMFGTQSEHRLQLLHPEVAYIQTGYEKQFGEYSSSYIKAQEDLKVVGKVSKFSWIPNHHYYLFAYSKSSDTLFVFERKDYKHITENYGYLFNNDTLDSLRVNQNIKKGTILQRSLSFDDNMNRMDGRNMRTIYTACEETMEDAIVISESASKKFTSPLVKKVNIIINDNDIPLNLYGDADNYKIFPDIGEESKNSILCGFRREKKEECLFSQSYNRLRELSISDDKRTVSGRVVDIDIYCNAPDKLDSNYYNSQLMRYYQEKQRMSREIVEVVEKCRAKHPTMKLDYPMDILYSHSLGALNGKQYFSERVFSNIVLDITLIEEIPVMTGDKLTNRYGGKGVVAKVMPDELMPRTKDGKPIEIECNMCGVYGRENIGQLFELTVSYISTKLIEYFKSSFLTIDEMLNLYYQLLYIVCPSTLEIVKETIDGMDDMEVSDFITSMASDNSIYLVIEPMSENMTIDKVAKLYQTFSWIKPETVYMPIINSAGEIRYAKSRRPLIYGYQYFYRLKQYAEEKFSVTSLSATNTRNENSKSKSSNNYKALYSRTPIRFGNMESGHLLHIGAEVLVQMLMIYSTSPSGRRLCSELLTGDPFSVDITLDMKSKNRNAEILNVYLKTMGLRLVFKKIRKAKVSPLHVSPLYFDIDPADIGKPKKRKQPLIFYNKDEVDIQRYIDEAIEGMHKPMVVHPLHWSPLEFTRPIPYRSIIPIKPKDDESD